MLRPKASAAPSADKDVDGPGAYGDTGPRADTGAKPDLSTDATAGASGARLGPIDSTVSTTDTARGQQPPLRIRVVRATGVRKADLLSKSDPYCVIELSGKKWQTHVVNNTHEPQWDFEINTVDYELGDRIVFSLYDHDIAKSDNFLGKHELSCAEWGYPGGFAGELCLADRHAKVGAPQCRLLVDIGPLARAYRPPQSSTQYAPKVVDPPDVEKIVMESYVCEDLPELVGAELALLEQPDASDKGMARSRQSGLCRSFFGFGCCMTD